MAHQSQQIAIPLFDMGFTDDGEDMKHILPTLFQTLRSPAG